MASKKDFKLNNPALAFISSATEAEEAEPVRAEVVEQPTQQLTQVRSSYTGETKSRRVQLLLRPSLVDAVKELAQRKGISMNEAVSEAIQAYLKANQ